MIWKPNNRNLFTDGRLYEYKEKFISAAVDTAHSIDREIFEANSFDAIVDNICQQYAIEPLELLNIDEPEYKSQNDIELRNQWHDGHTRRTKGYRVCASVQFKGQPELFYKQPSRHRISYPDHIVNESSGTITIWEEFSQGDLRPEEMKRRIEEKLDGIRINVENSCKDLQNYHEALSAKVKNALTDRLKSLEEYESIQRAFKIPIKKTTGASPLGTKQVHIKQNTISPLSTKKDSPGAYISDNDYEFILESIRNMGAALEVSQASKFQDENSLRDVLLVGLHASISVGSITGESFRKNGRTDILIPFENSAAFIAECKLWDGPKYMSDGISQLLGYSSWRDVKLSLIIFNKNAKNFSKIQSQVPEIFKEHDNYIRKEHGTKDGEWRFVLSKPDDNDRHVKIHVQLFDIKDKEPK